MSFNNNVIKFDEAKLKFDKIKKVKKLLYRIDDELQVLMGKLSHSGNNYITTSISSINDALSGIDEIGYTSDIYDGHNLPLSFKFTVRDKIEDLTYVGILRIESDHKEMADILNHIPYNMQIKLRSELSSLEYNVNDLWEVAFSSLKNMQVYIDSDIIGASL